jgi:hypothetical protein
MKEARQNPLLLLFEVPHTLQLEDTSKDSKQISFKA